MVLVDRKPLRLPVHHGARCEHHARHVRVGGGLEDVEGAAAHHLLALARLLLAAGPAERGLMEHDVRARDVRLHGLAVTDVDLHEPRAACRDRGREVLRDTAHERVERDDLARAGGDRGIDEVGPDGPGATGHDDARAGERTHFTIRFTWTFVVFRAVPRSSPPSALATVAKRACAVASSTVGSAGASNATSQPSGLLLMCAFVVASTSCSTARRASPTCPKRNACAIWVPEVPASAMRSASNAAASPGAAEDSLGTRPASRWA